MVEVHANITARTRFIIPTIPSATVSRRCLVSRLDGGACDLTLIAAAPGSGKTALLAQWASVREDPVAWLSCNRDDADPSWFWRDVITAIRGAWTDVALGDTELTQDRESRHLAIEIANELEAHAQSGVIIIDDFHLAAPEPDAMVAFIDALPSSIRLVLGTRHDPLFPLGRMRVQGRLLELRQSDLRFDHDEMVEALDRLGVALAPKDLEQLESLTEGWAAGVHLAGLSLRGERVSEAMMRRLAATDRGLIDFLMNEVVDLQPAELLEFLMVGAELGEFDAELCDQVMGSSDGRVMIERVAAANLFLVGLDDEGTWFRFHHLFGEFLRARLRRTDPDRVGVIHRAAADSFGRRGDLLTAVRHSLSAGDTDGALDRLTTYMANSTTLADQSVGAAAAQAWLDEHGATTLDDSPERILSCVVALNGSNRHDAAEVWLRRVEANESHLDLAGRCTLEVVRSFHLLYAGDPERALPHAEKALAIAEEHHLDGVWVPSIPLMTVQAHLWLD
ncbi:MAG TPA: hypothetical protein VFU85_10725, partial [Nocardioides sp.]|nr:hypothetical protein [Nocardioides sp.]